MIETMKAIEALRPGDLVTIKGKTRVVGRVFRHPSGGMVAFESGRPHTFAYLAAALRNHQAYITTPMTGTEVAA